MNILNQTLGSIVVVTIDGVVDSMAAGPLYDALVAQVKTGTRKIVVEFTDTVVLNRAGIRGLIVAAKLLKGRRGQMRICGAQPKHEQFLKSVSLQHLLTFDRDRAASIAAMTQSGEASVGGNHLLPLDKACRPVPSGVRAQLPGLAMSRPSALASRTHRPLLAASGCHAPE